VVTKQIEAKEEGVLEMLTRDSELEPERFEEIHDRPECIVETVECRTLPYRGLRCLTHGVHSRPIGGGKDMVVGG